MAKTFVLRPHRINRPLEPEAGSGAHRPRRRAALTFAFAALAVFATASLAACGGDDDSDAVATTAPGATIATTAGELIPDLTPLGFAPTTNSESPGFTESATSAVKLFENPAGTVKSLRFDIALSPNTNVAASQFNALSEALKNPPPDLFGGSTKQLDGTPVHQADQSRSFKTDRPDAEGTFVYSDIHRFGRAIVIMYTIGPAGPETDAIRKQVAEQLSARAPR